MQILCHLGIAILLAGNGFRFTDPWGKEVVFIGKWDCLKSAAKFDVPLAVRSVFLQFCATLFSAHREILI
jgi:hypothetical protein